MDSLNYIPLRATSQYSLLEGAMQIESIVEKAINYNIPAVGLTDRNNFIHYPFLDALLQNKKLSLPIYDCEGEFDDPLGHLDWRSICYGIGLSVVDYPEIYSQHFTENYSGDCTSADVLFQLFVMGDVVYG